MSDVKMNIILEGNVNITFGKNRYGNDGAYEIGISKPMGVKATSGNVMTLLSIAYNIHMNGSEIELNNSSIKGLLDYHLQKDEYVNTVFKINPTDL